MRESNIVIDLGSIHAELVPYILAQDSAGLSRALRAHHEFSDAPIIQFAASDDPYKAVFHDFGRRSMAIDIDNRPLIASAVLIRLLQIWPFLRQAAAKSYAKKLAIDLGDIGSGSDICFCGTSERLTLIPDCEFLHSLGYDEARLVSANQIKWSGRSSRPYWRGSPTGHRSGSIFALHRTQLCHLGHKLGYDCYFSSMLQISPEDAELLKEASLIVGRDPWSSVLDKKYNVDIDGNSSAWSGFFLKLLSGGVVLKIDSAYRQWYYDLLVPCRIMYR